jgi:molecular chaperone DnaJ
MAKKRDYYEVLGIRREATIEEIKKSYRQMAMKNHPDRNPGDAEAEIRFKEAAEAYEILSDDGKRQRYDRYGHAGLDGAGVHNFQNADDIMSAFGEIFQNAFFGDMFGQRRRGPRPGGDLAVKLEIDLIEAARGVTKTLSLSRSEPCGTCNGSGARKGTVASTCNYCGGQGQVVQSRGFFQVATTCPACGGEGVRITDPCGDCRGTGRTQERVQLDVDVPPGVDTGIWLQVRNQGELGDPGAPRGNLRIQISVRPHSIFERRGNDIICQIPIHFTQAALGAEIEVPTLDGRDRLTIPRGTQSGEVFRLRQKGVPDVNGRGRGDEVIEVVVETPRHLTARQEELLRELAKLDHDSVMPRQKSFFEKLKSYFTEPDEQGNAAEGG